MNRCAICAQLLQEQDALKTVFRTDATVHADCWLKMEDKVREYRDRDHTSYQPYQSGDDIHVSRSAQGQRTTNVPRVYYLHSRDGFEWGFPGSGPSDLALNILLLFTDVRTAHRLHQPFKEEFVKTLPESGGRISEAVIRSWLLLRAINA